MFNQNKRNQGASEPSHKEVIRNVLEGRLLFWSDLGAQRESLSRLDFDNEPLETAESQEKVVKLIDARIEQAILAGEVVLDSSEGVLQHLAQSDSAEVRVFVAGHDSASEEVLLRLSWDPEYPVKAKVLENANTPPDVLWRFISNETTEFSLFSHIISNASVTREMLRVLCDVKNGAFIVCYALDHSRGPHDLLPNFAVRPEKPYRMAVARNLNTPPQVLETLSKDPYEDVRRSVAGNPLTPYSTVLELMRDSSDRVRESAGRNVQSLEVFEREHGKTISSVVELLRDFTSYEIGTIFNISLSKIEQARRECPPQG